MTRKHSVLSRFRVAGVAVIVGVALVAASFYAIVNAHFLSAILARTLGPYSDALAQHIFDNRPNPEMWRQIAENHRIRLLVELPDSEPVAFDEEGRQIEWTDSMLDRGQVRAHRTGPDGTQVVIAWPILSFRASHFPLLTGLLIMVTAVVGTAFWFLNRQLKPLGWLRGGVDAVAAGDFTTRVPVVRDDEIGQVAEAFNEMAGRVGEMIEDRERLLADVSHELRSPLARMKVALELLPEGEKRDVVKRDLEEMERLITVLLEREALRDRAARFVGDDVDLVAVAAEVVDVYQGEGPGVELVGGTPVTIHGDRDLLKLLVQNLVDNAVKFSDRDSGPVRVSVEGDSKGAILRVTDEGIGIPPEKADRLFEPFVKTDPARGHHVGYGVGLNLCQRIVQLHRGTIELAPREPRGTQATVKFGDRILISTK